MFSQIVYICAGLGLLVSFTKDVNKTKMALKKAWKSLENILPQFLSILLLIGMALTVLSPEIISNLLGKQSGFLGFFLASVIGSNTLIPGFIAFPLVAALLKNGAGYAQIAVFVSTLMMVGFVTLPLEMKTFGKKAAIIRNVAALVFSYVSAMIIGGVLQ